MNNRNQQQDSKEDGTDIKMREGRCWAGRRWRSVLGLPDPIVRRLVPELHPVLFPTYPYPLCVSNLAIRSICNGSVFGRDGQ